MLFRILYVLLCGAIVVAAKTTLPLDDVNVVVVTDVHSFVSGHGRHEPQFDANYGHVLSFVEQLRAVEPDKDIFFVMNGDFNDGTAMSQRVPSALTPILEQMPFDALTVGNHELYYRETIDHMTEPGGFIEWFGSRYVTSNVILSDEGKPLGKRYHILEGLHSRVLVLGFMYEMEGGSWLKQVEPVADVIQAGWFVNMLASEQFDSILVLAHMDLKHELVDFIKDALRFRVGTDMPIQFITGHTHYRGYNIIDKRTASFEAGRYLDTVGFVSFPAQGTNSAEFQHVFVDANVNKLASTLGLSSDQLMTDNGKRLSDFIDRTRVNLGIDEVVGCSPRTFFWDVSITRSDSLWGLYVKEVIPRQFPGDEDTKRVVIQSKESALRYNLFKGDITIDDVTIVNPFNDSFVKVAEGIPAEIVGLLDTALNAESNQEYLPNLPEYIMSGSYSDPNGLYSIYTGEFDTGTVQETLKTVKGNRDRSGLLLEPPQVLEYGTTQIWMDFVRTEWPNCSTGWHMQGNRGPLEGEAAGGGHGRRKGIMAISVILVITALLVGFILLRRRHEIEDDVSVEELLQQARNRWHGQSEEDREWTAPFQFRNRAVEEMEKSHDELSFKDDLSFREELSLNGDGRLA